MSVRRRSPFTPLTSLELRCKRVAFGGCTPRRRRRQSTDRRREPVGVHPPTKMDGRPSQSRVSKVVVRAKYASAEATRSLFALNHHHRLRFVRARLPLGHVSHSLWTQIPISPTSKTTNWTSRCRSKRRKRLGTDIKSEARCGYRGPPHTLVRHFLVHHAARFSFV